MAWDALQGRFQKQRTEEDKGLAQEARSVGGSGGMSGYAPQANPTGGFGGNAGSTTSGGPVSAGFVNYADLYSANEGKAKQMAADVYKGAESKAQVAKDSLQAAQTQFQNKAQQGTAKGTIGGPHGTRIDNYNPAPPPPKAPTQGVSQYGEGAGATGAVGGGNGGNQGTLTQSLEADPDYWTPRVQQSAAPGATNAGASRYASLFGPAAAIQAPDAAGRADYHHSVDLLGAKSGAGQDYTGPDSLKDSMGDDAYGQLAKDFQGAQDSIAGLQNSGGIAEALGYAGDQTGNAALDAGLTQTAGQSNFKRLADRYSGLGKELATAQSDSLATVGRADAASDVAADTWDKLLADYDAEQAANAPKPPERKEKPAGQGFQPYDGDGNPTYANQLLEESGFSLSELNDISSELTPEERAYLYGTYDSFSGTIFGAMTGQNDTNAMHKQNILAKLAAARAKKNGGG